jgi:hypothetical protein
MNTGEAQDEKAVIEEARKEFYRLGGSDSVYGQAARESFIRQQLGSGWAGNPADLHREAREEAARQIAKEPLESGRYRVRETYVGGLVGGQQSVIEQREYATNTFPTDVRSMPAEMFPGLGGYSGGDRRFTRAEVLAVLKAQKADIDHGADTEDVVFGTQHRLLANLIRIFERIE